MKAVGRLVALVMVTAATQAAWAQQITGRLYPEKTTYLVGEPVFVVLDLANTGSEPVWFNFSCEWLDTRFEAPTAAKPHAGVSLFGCVGGGVAGSCGSSAKEILPSDHYEHRYLLDGPFRLDSPGVYPIRAWHKVEIYSGELDYTVIATKEIVSEFQLNFVEGSEGELAAAYVPVLRDLESPDALTHSLALAAVVQNPPRFLEDLILSLADDPNTEAASVPALKRLATPRAKAKLAELSGLGRPEYIRQMAISALAELGDPAYCSSMLEIARQSREYSRFIALRAAGYLCGEKALPLATSLLAESDHSARFEAAYALGNSHTRDAVPLLISLLIDPDPNVRRAARDSLNTLTHRSLQAGIDDETAARNTYNEWFNWWRANGVTSKMYGPDECGKSLSSQ